MGLGHRVRVKVVALCRLCRAALKHMHVALACMCERT